MPQVRWKLIPLAFVALFVAGCREDEAIRTYQVAKVRVPAPRLLAAVIPVGDKVWFFKLAGAAPAVAGESAHFHEFVSSLRFSTNAETPVTWTLPESWRDAGGKSQLRYATLRAGPEALEVSITPLGVEAGDLKNNVNRWRGQIGLKPVADDAELRSVCKSVTVDGKAGTLVDMTGVAGAATATMTPRAQSAGPTGAEPKSQMNSSTIVPRRSDGSVNYTIPSGWTEIPATGMRAAAFRVADGNQSAEITVIPLGGMAGGLLPNVNRWRKEVGLGDTTEAALAKESKSLDVGGTPAVYVDLAGPEKRTLGVIIQRGERTWFVKFQGPKNLVDKEREHFEAFARSLRLGSGERP